MNILYTLDSGKLGGMEFHTFDLARGMKSKGHNVYVWCREGNISNKFKDIGVTVNVTEIKTDIDPFYIRSLVLYIKENHIDIVHCHELKACFNSIIACALSKTKCISHIHTPISEWRIKNKLKKHFTRLESFLYSIFVNLFSTYEIALTESRKNVKVSEGIRDDKLYIIPNGLDTKTFNLSMSQRLDYRDEIRVKYNIPKNAFVFGNISRLTQEKGHEVLIKAFKNFILSELFEKKSFYLLIAGGGDLEKDLKELSVKLEISDKVIFTGVFPSEDQLKLYSTFDMFIFPSLAEGFGLVLTEAMYMQLPIISSDIEVLREVGGDTINYFKTGDYNSLSDSMIEVFQKQSNGDNLNLELERNRVEDMFSYEEFIDNYEFLYKKVLNKIDFQLN